MIEKLIRPLQRAYFSCGLACVDDKRAASEISACVERCTQPMSAVEQRLGAAQQAFQQRIGRCHQLAGEAVKPRASHDSDGQPSPADIAAYVARLRPCVDEELGKVDNLLLPVREAVPPALADMRTNTRYS